MKNNDFRIFSSILFFIPLLLFLSLFYFHSIPNDAVQYSTLGHNLAQEGFYDDPYGVVPGWIQSPGWPMVLGLFSYIIPLRFLAPFTTLLVSLLLAFFFFLFIKKQFAPTMAWISLVILALNPQFLISSRDGLSEPFFAFLHILLFASFYPVLLQNRKCSFVRTLLIAALAVLLALTRSEGIFYVVLIPVLFMAKMLYQLLIKNKTVNGEGLGTLYYLVRIIIFVVLSSLFFYPYGKWIEHKSGDLNILAKVTFSRRIGTVAKVLNPQEDLFFTDRDSFDELGWFGLDTTDYSLYTAHLLGPDYYRNLKHKLPNYNTSLKSYCNLILQNIKSTIRFLLRSDPFPEIFLLLILVGLLFFLKQNPPALLILAIWLAPSFYFLLSHVEERFFYVLLPYLSFIAGYGVYHLSKKFKRPHILIYTLIFFLALNSAVYYTDYFRRLCKNEVFYQVAQKLKNNIPSSAKLCAKNFSISFYSGHGFAKMPYTSVEHLKHYLNVQETKYLLLGNEVYSVRKAFMPIYEGERADLFKHQQTIKTPYQTFKLFKVLD